SLRLIEAIPWPARNPLLLTIVAFGLGIFVGYFYRSGRFFPAVASAVATALVLVTLIGVTFSDDNARGSTDTPSAATMSDSPRRLPDGTAFVAKPTQRLLEIRTVAARLETAQAAVRLIGRVIGDPNRTSVVQSVHGGRVIPLDGGLPRIGQAVR